MSHVTQRDTQDNPAATTAPFREIVELACRAPSVHNTQPWRWQVRAGRLELHADRSRQLWQADPDGRNLVLSCGAALHHAQVAAAACGWRLDVERCPDPARPDLLAVLTPVSMPVTPQAEELLEALVARRTDRRRFTSWPLPAERLARLAGFAERWGALVLPLTDPSSRAEVDRLMRRADEVQRADAEYAAELAWWVGGGGADGIPQTSIPAVNPHRPALPSRFRDGSLPDPLHESSETVDGLVVICSAADGQEAWLRAGETLSALWLDSVRHGLSLLPLSQVVEVPETRAALRGLVLSGMPHPQLLARLGWQEMTRAELPLTPRRAVEDVLVLD